MNATTAPSRRARWAASTTVAVALFAAACGKEPVTTSNPTPPPPARRTVAAASASASSSAAAPRLELSEGDFTAGDQNRDPFRNYAELFVATPGKKTSQQKVVADHYALDELKLVAVVTGHTAARAMFIDPTGKGHVVTRGEFVGRSESIRTTAQRGQQTYEANWRVDRIRDGDVVFIREDPERPNVPAATRVIALRPEGDPTPAMR